MTMRYSHLAPAHNAAAVEKLAAALERSTRLLGPQNRLPTPASRSGPRANVRGLERNWNVLSGPQTPAKKKLVEEHRLRSGGGGNRTPVRRCIHERIYVRSPRTYLAALAPTGGISRGQPAFDLGPRPAGADGGPAREMAPQPALRAQAGEASRPN